MVDTLDWGLGWPLELVIAGSAIRRQTGYYPDPAELQERLARIPDSWRQAIDLWDDLYDFYVERPQRKRYEQTDPEKPPLDWRRHR